ncbi:MAG: LamG domain-containing protein [Kiritimatiellae bacterium]|nr:LamG domain-containing protein [Kiritimatiellia bacterium]
MKKNFLAVVMIGLVSGAWGDAAFDADTLAFYPFNEGEVETTPTLRQPVILNAVDAAAYRGTPYQAAAYGTVTPMTYSDDVPGAYIYANETAAEPLYGPGDFQAIKFPDMAAGTDPKGVYWPLTTNESARSAIVTYQDVNGALRPQGMACIVLDGLNTALANLDTWTVELFFRVESACTQPGSSNGSYLLFTAEQATGAVNAQTQLKFLVQYGAWNKYAVFGGSKSAAITMSETYRAQNAGWQHLALVHAAGKTTTYLNYVSVNTIDHTYEAPAEGTPLAPLILGDSRNSFPAQPFYGKMAAVRVTKRALSVPDFLVASDTAIRRKVITGDYEVAAEGEDYSYVSVVGPARITGGALRVERKFVVESGSVTLDNAAVTLTQSGAALTVPAGAVLTAHAPIGGGAIAVQADGTVTFAGANTFTGTLTLQGAGALHVANDAAFGSPESGTFVYSRAAEGNLKMYFDGVDISEPFDCWLESNSLFNFSANTTNVLRGVITGKTTRNSFTFGGGSYTVISNRVSNMGYVVHSGNNTARVDIWGALDEYRANFGAGVYHHFVRHPEMFGVRYGLMPNAGTHVMEIPNVFAESAEATQAYPSSLLNFGANNGTLDLNGFDQRFASLIGTARGTIQSALPATLHLDAQVAPEYTPDNSNWLAYERMTFNGAFKGAAAFSVEGPIPMDLGGVSTTTGRLTVANGGQVKFLSGGSWAGEDIVVTGEGSRLEFTAGANLSSAAAVISVSAGGHLCIPGGTVRLGVAQLVVDGETLDASGTYGAVGSGAEHELSCLEGPGMFLVTGRAPTVCIWSASGPDAAVSAATSWKDGVKPDSTVGQDSAIFSENGDTANVDVPLWLQGLTLRRPAGGAFTFAAGGGTLLLGSGGITADEARGDAARAYTNDVPTTIGDTQTWLLPSESSVFVQNGALAGSENATLFVTGNGDLHLTGDNSAFLGTMDFSVSGDASCSGVVAHVWHPRALGGPDGVTRIGAKTVSSTGKRTAKLVFHGTNEIDRALDFYGNDSPRIALGEPYSKVTFNKMFDIHGGLLRPETPTGCEVIFAGGLSTGCYRIAPPAGGKLVFTNKVCALGSFDSTSYTAAQSVIEIHTSSNSYNSTYGISLSGKVLIDLYATDAVCRTSHGNSPGGVAPMIRLGVYRDSTARQFWTDMRLNGHDQHAGCLDEKDDSRRYATEDSHSRILSATPAQLYVMQNVDKLVSSLAFEEAAGLTLEGTGTLTLSNVTSTTTGRLEVAGGNLVLHSAWPNVREVVVNGSLALKAPQRFGKRVTVLRLEEGCTLDLGGNDQYVKEVYVDGVRLRAPTAYTAASPELKGRVTGAGRLRVFGDGPGTTFMLR